MDAFVNMYYLRRAMLVYQFVFGTYPKLTDILSGDATDQDEFAYVVENATNIINAKIIAAPQTPELKALCDEYNCSDVLQVVECCDFDVITDKHHHRKFFNEIENDEVFMYFIEMFKRIWNVDEVGEFFIEVYDWGDHRIYFADRDDLCSMVNNYDVAPYTAYQVVDNADVELWSE